MVEVICTDEFQSWYKALDTDDLESVTKVIDLLEEEGVLLGDPYSSALRNCRYAFRELRPKRGRSPLRVIYAFDPNRDAVLIIGGDKSGKPNFYKQFIPKAEQIWEDYLT